MMLPIQTKILELLKEINEICTKNNIRWYIMYGTLLGAIRHNGFIPWDDDADIVMTYDNWVKFKEAFNKEHLENRKLTSIDIDSSEYGQVMARYHNTEEEQLIHYNTIFNLQNGIFIDIFILDNFPKSLDGQQKYHQTFIDFCELAHKRYCPSNYLPGRSKYVQKIFPFLLKNRQQELQKYIDTLASLGNDSSTTYIQRSCINHKYGKNLLVDVVYKKFEDTYLPVPQKYYDVLCLQYGESWMYVPKQQLTHENFHILSDKNPFSGSIAQQFHNYRKGILHKFLYLCSKIINTTYNPELKTWKICSRDLVVEYVKEKIKANGFINYNDKLLYYLTFQTNAWLVGRYIAAGWWNWYNHTTPTFITVDHEFLADSIDYLINHENLDLACMLLQAMQSSSYKPTQRVINSINIVQLIKKAYSEFYSSEYENCINTALKAMKSYPQNLFLWRIYIYAKYAINKSEFVIPEGLSLRILRDPEVALVRASIAFRERKIGNALRYMKACAQGTRNGIVLRKLLELSEEAYDFIYANINARQDLLDRLKEIIIKAKVTLGELKTSSDIRVLPSSQTISASEKIAQTSQKWIYDAQEKQFSLLQELAKLCEFCGVRYYLFGDALRIAATTKKVFQHEARLSIAVDARECRKLLKFYKRYIRSDRFLESPISNPDFPEFALYYGAKDSLEIDTSLYGFRLHHGIYVEVKILPVAQQSWRKTLRMLAESTWAMEHGLMPVTVRRYIFHIVLSVLRLFLGKRRVANWIFRKIFLKGKRIYNSQENYQILWKKKFINIPVKWFSGNVTSSLEKKEMPVPLLEGIPLLLKKLYGAKWNVYNQNLPTAINPFHIVDPCYSYENFLKYIQTTSCDLNHLWKQRLHILHFGWFRTFFQRKLARDWNFILFLNDRYRMYREVFPLKKHIQYCISRGDMKRLAQLMNSTAMKECLNKTEKYLSQGLCFNFDPEIFNIVIEHFRNQKKISQVKRLLKLNKKQKYPKITLKDLTQKEF